MFSFSHIALYFYYQTYLTRHNRDTTTFEIGLYYEELSGGHFNV